MLIRLVPDQGSHAVLDVDNLRALSIQITAPCDDESLARSLGTLGHLELPDHAWLDVSALRDASGRASDPAWAEQYDAMIAYAGSKGWLNDDRSLVRAHIDRTEDGH